jgi:hypothetical protein
MKNHHKFMSFEGKELDSQCVAQCERSNKRREKVEILGVRDLGFKNYLN